MMTDGLLVVGKDDADDADAPTLKRRKRLLPSSPPPTEPDQLALSNASPPQSPSSPITQSPVGGGVVETVSEPDLVRLRIMVGRAQFLVTLDTNQFPLFIGRFPFDDIKCSAWRGRCQPISAEGAFPDGYDLFVGLTPPSSDDGLTTLLLAGRTCAAVSKTVAVVVRAPDGRLWLLTKTGDGRKQLRIDERHILTGERQRLVAVQAVYMADTIDAPSQRPLIDDDIGNYGWRCDENNVESWKCVRTPR
jgi:hypothetical protein